MDINCVTRCGFTVVRVFGDLDRNASGRLLDTLIACAGDGSAKLIVDLSGVRFVTQAGVRGIIVVAKLLKTGRGAMRICGASLSVESLLRSLGYNHLLKFDPSLNVAITILSAEGLGIGGRTAAGQDEIRWLLGRNIETSPQSPTRNAPASSQDNLLRCPRKTGAGVE